MSVWQSIWQKSMIALARNGAITRFMHRNAATSRLAGSFVGGKTPAQAAKTAKRMKTEGINISAFYLGEYVDDEATVAQGVTQLMQVMQELAKDNLQLHVSVDPTQIGSVQSLELLHTNAQELATALQRSSSGQRKVLMIDMEDSGVTQLTLDLYHSLSGKGFPVAVTLQAYLHRSKKDLDRLVEQGAMVRLVKGAFAEPASLAATQKDAIDLRFRQAMATLFSPRAKQTGCYPVIASHDKAMIDHAIHLAEKNGWRKNEYEFEMLYGVRDALQRQLAGQGYTMRAYLPFGESWFPYAIRRVGENPANTVFVLRAMLGG